MIAIDLCCGLGGWAVGLMDAGFEVIGFDVEDLPYPGILVVQDIREINGARFKHADLIVASPPCQEFSRLDIPQTRPTANPNPDMSIVNACFRIAEEAGVPLVLENVRGAKKFIPGDAWRWGSQYLWGNGLPECLPTKVPPRGGKKLGWKTPRERAIIPYDLSRLVASWHGGPH